MSISELWLKDQPSNNWRMDKPGVSARYHSSRLVHQNKTNGIQSVSIVEMRMDALTPEGALRQMAAAQYVKAVAGAEPAYPYISGGAFRYPDRCRALQITDRHAKQSSIPLPPLTSQQSDICKLYQGDEL